MRLYTTRISTPLRLLVAFVAGVIPITFTHASAAEEMECEALQEIIPEVVTDWMKADKRFNLDYAELGWQEWTPQFEIEVGMPSRTSWGGPPHSVEGYPYGMWYDRFSWMALDLDGDGIEDRIAVTDVVTGAKRLRVDYSMFGFCGSGAEGNATPQFQFCGSVYYGHGHGLKSLITKDAPTYSVQEYDTRVLQRNQLFLPLDVDGTTIIASISAAVASESGQRRYFSDFWQLGDGQFNRIKSCDWSR